MAFRASAIRLEASINEKNNVVFPKDLIEKIPDIIANERKIFFEDLKNKKAKINITRRPTKAKRV